MNTEKNQYLGKDMASEMIFFLYHQCVMQTVSFMIHGNQDCI